MGTVMMVEDITMIMVVEGMVMVMTMVVVEHMIMFIATIKLKARRKKYQVVPT